VGERDDLRQRTASSVAWTTVEIWTSRFVSLLIVVVLARLIDPDQFGITVLASTFSSVLGVFVSSGFAQALIQLKEIDEKDKSTAFWTSLGISLILYAALAFSSPFWADVMHEPALSAVLPVTGLTLPLSALSITPSALLQRDFQNRKLAVRTNMGVFASAVVGIVLALLGFQVWALVFQLVTASAVSTATLWGSTTWRPRFSYSRASLKKLWAVGVSIIGINLLEAVQSNIDKLVVGAFFSSQALGYYYIAQRIGIVVSDLIVSVMSRVSLQALSRVQDDLPRLNSILRQMTFLSTGFGVIVFGLLAALSQQIIPGVFGPQWEPEIRYVWILSIGWALATAMTFDRNALIAVSRSRSALGISVLQGATSIGLVFALLPLGVTGVALSRLARIVTWPFRAYVLHKHVGMPVWRYFSQIIRALVAGVPVIGGIVLLQSTGWAHVSPALWSFALPVGILGAAAYVGLLWVVAEPESKRSFAGLLRDVLARLLRRRVRVSEIGAHE
jgi:O-antigen/teichoic acid export membrane protein